MIDLLSSLSGLLAPLWEMSLTAAYVTAVVAVLRFFLKKRAPRQVLCLLWLVVFARLLIPVSLESPLSIVPGALPGPEETHLSQEAPPDPAPVQEPGSILPQRPVQAGSTVLPPVSQGAVNPTDAAPALTVPSGAASTVSPPEVRADFPWQALLAGVWLAGAAALGGCGLASYLRLRHRLLDAIRAEDGAWEHPSVHSPFIVGMVRPKIYLPAGLRGQPRQFILCHERAHLRRLDHIVKPLCWLALVLHWFNPAVWLAFILMSRDIEAACDEAVLRRLGDGVKADYSATLLALATRGRIPAPCPLAFGEEDAKGRIQNVLGYRRPALWIAVMSALMAVMAAVCLLTDPVSAKAPDGTGPSAALSSPSPEPLSSQAPDDAILSEPIRLDGWMEEVLSGRRQFYSTSQGKQMDLEPLNAAYGYTDSYFDLDYKLALVDLDGDGEPEVVLEPCYIGTPANESDQNLLQLGYLILHADGDQVYGYTPGNTAFSAVKSTGVYQFSHYFDGAYSWGWGRARFTAEGLEPDPIAQYLSPNESEVDPGSADYYVDGKPATSDEFFDASETYNLKAAPAWYRWYEDTGLLPSVVQSDQSTYTPKFLGDGMRELYRQASYFYYHLFGESTAGICELGSASLWPSGLYDPTDTVERDGLTYVRAAGQFARWADLMTAVDDLFTRDFWDACNQWDGHELFINVGGDTYFLPASRVYGDYYRTGPAPFTLVEQTEEAVTVTLTAGYNDYRAGEDGVAWGQRLERGYDYTVDYPIRYVKTEDGWRLDEFHYGRTDHRGYTLGHILWQTDPLHAVNGWMDDAALRQVGPDVFLDWDGTTYCLEPDVNAATFTGRMYAVDVDGDGQTEVSLVYVSPQNTPVIAVYERTAGGLERRTFDTSVLQSYFDGRVTVERRPEGGLTLTHHGAQKDTAIQLSDEVFSGWDWLREGELLAKMEPDVPYAGLYSEAPLTPPFAVNTFIRLTGGMDYDGPFVARLSFMVDYDGSSLTLGKLYMEPYSEFAVPGP